MDQIVKFLKKLPPKQYKSVAIIIQQILAKNIDQLDVKKLKGFQNVYRVRKGKIRIIFKQINGFHHILKIDFRDDNTY